MAGQEKQESGVRGRLTLIAIIEAIKSIQTCQEVKMKVDIEKLMKELSNESGIFPYYSNEDCEKAELFGGLYNILRRCIVDESDKLQ